jgi:hypothetical protein
MRVVTCVFLSLLIAPAVPAAQSLELYGSAGPTIIDTGNSATVGAGFSPHPRLALVFSFERTHLSTRTTTDEYGSRTSFRGGSLFLGTAELRVMPFGRQRFGPYGVAGFAAGASHPNVNALFPQRVTNQVRAMFAGGGVQVPLGRHLRVFGDVRIMLGAEGVEGIVAVMPARAGVAWTF